MPRRAGNQALYLTGKRAHTRGKSSCWKGLPASKAYRKTPFSTQNSRLFALGLHFIRNTPRIGLKRINTPWIDLRGEGQSLFARGFQSVRLPWKALTRLGKNLVWRECL
jgi:hypothetical protein